MSLKRSLVRAALRASRVNMILAFEKFPFEQLDLRQSVKVQLAIPHHSADTHTLPRQPVFL